MRDAQIKVLPNWITLRSAITRIVNEANAANKHPLSILEPGFEIRDESQRVIASVSEVNSEHHFDKNNDWAEIICNIKLGE